MQPITIGTPLTPSVTRVMLPGSGENGKEVIITLQRLDLALAIGKDSDETSGRAKFAASKVVRERDVEWPWFDSSVRTDIKR